MTTFPPLRMAVLTALSDVKSNMDALNDPSCPYDEETKRLLRDLLAVKEVEVVVEKEIVRQGRGRPTKEVELSDEDKARLTEGIQDLIGALDSMGTGEGLETNQRIQITKTKAGLLRDLLQMRERNTAAARIEEFMETVMSILNDYISDEDRDLFLKRLEPYR
jgi:hypothetical protein